jgi:hypothetical protein
MGRVMRLDRLPDWRARLGHHGRASARCPFAWGAHDCALFAAGAVQAITGLDIAAEWRGRYTTARGAMRVLRRDGGDGLVGLAQARFDEIPVATAQVGDLAVLPSESDDRRAGFDHVLGVVIGEHIWVLRPDGLGAVGLLQAERAFAV